jgi:hypothetical protein
MGIKLAKPDYYEFIGECYVHGYIDGEAVILSDNGRTLFSIEIISLRGVDILRSHYMQI